MLGTPSGDQSGTTRDDRAWWRDAVIYQVYPRSWADSDGDGIGDLPGITSRLEHLVALGVDAVWLSPFYTSPQRDAGYDVADFRDVDPIFGTLADADALVARAHDLGLRVIVDVVPNHTSDEHAWFREALASEPGSAARARYLFRDGRGDAGELPPNNWHSIFGGPAWTRLPDGDWYLHLFAPGQPDLNWEHDEVRQEFEDILAFWFDRGVDGFRIDVAHGLVKKTGLPDSRSAAPGSLVESDEGHPAWDQDGVHEVYRGWRAVADRYAPERIFIAEAWVSSNDRLARYLRSDELHTAFQFDFLRVPWRAEVMRTVIDDAIGAAATVGAPPTWVLSNHDVTRTVTRFARSQPAHLVGTDWERGRWADEDPDHELGRKRARAAALVQLALPGTAYVYQGEELALEEIEDLPDDVRQDPTWAQSGFTDVGRDGCRIPLPWTDSTPPYGFAAQADVATWLPQPAHWAEHSVEAQDRDPDSTLNLYRAALRLRRTLWRDAGDVKWLQVSPHVAAFERGGAQCWVNTGTDEVALPEVGAVALASAPGVGRVLPPDCAVWLRSAATLG